MMVNATFNNISVISWRSMLLVEETGVPGENHRHVVSQWQTWLHNVVTLFNGTRMIRHWREVRKKISQKSRKIYLIFQSRQFPNYETKHQKSWLNWVFKKHSSTNDPGRKKNTNSFYVIWASTKRNRVKKLPMRRHIISRFFG